MSKWQMANSKWSGLDPDSICHLLLATCRPAKRVHRRCGAAHEHGHAALEVELGPALQGAQQVLMVGGEQRHATAGTQHTRPFREQRRIQKAVLLLGADL